MSTTTEPKPRKGRKFSKDEVEEYAQRMADEAVKEAEARIRAEAAPAYIEEPNLNGSFSFSSDDEDGDEGKSPAQIQGEQIQRNAFDIFDYIQTNYASKGTEVYYIVKRNGHFLSEMGHPCSWKKIQNLHKGGSYLVIAKDFITKQYIKQQQQFIEELEKVEAPVVPPVVQQPALDMTEVTKQVLSTFQTLQEMSGNRRENEMRDTKSSENNLLTTVLTLMQGQQDSSRTLFMEQQKAMMEFQKSMMESQRINMDSITKVLEKMDEKNSKLFEKLATPPKKDGLDSLEILSLLQKAEDRGWDKMQTVMDLSRERAEELAEGGGEGEGRSSILSSLASAIVPLLANMNQQVSAVQVPQVQVPPARRDLPPASAAQPPAARPQPGARPNPGPAQARPAGAPKAGPTSGGAPVARSQGPTTVSQVPAQKTETVDVDLDAIFKEASIAQQTIATIAIPKIAAVIYDANVPVEAAGSHILGMLRGQGFGPDVVAKEFTLEFMIKIARGFGIMDRDEWFKGLRKFLESQVPKTPEIVPGKVEDADIQIDARDVEPGGDSHNGATLG